MPSGDEQSRGEVDAMTDIVALGELLIDFTEAGTSPDGQMLFERNPGGAPANVAAIAARQGRSAAFLGKVGDDMHGRFLIDTLRQAGVDTSGVVLSKRYFTTLAFVALHNGERTFSFARKPGADTQLAIPELSDALLCDCRIFHFGSLSLTCEPVRSATLHATQRAKDSGAVISYDPNYRAPLWPDQKTAVANMRSVLPLVDVIKLSGEETALMTDVLDPWKAAEALCSSGVPCVTVTLGVAGAIVCNREGSQHIPGFQVPVLDTTGAGDAYFGAFLTRMLELSKRPAELTLSELTLCARYGNAAAACCIGKRGAIPAMPDRAATLARLLSAENGRT